MAQSTHTSDLKKDTLASLDRIHAEDPAEGKYWRTAGAAIEVISAQESAIDDMLKALNTIESCLNGSSYSSEEVNPVLDVKITLSIALEIRRIIKEVEASNVK